MSEPMAKRYKRPNALNHKLHEHYSLAQKLDIVRKRLHAKGYTSARHKDAPRDRSRSYLRPTDASRYKRKVSLKTTPGSATRYHFTAQEIEMNWLCLCEVLQFVGGNKALLARLIGFNVNNISHWVKSGRCSPFGAVLIGECADIPLTKENVRPDISAAGWKAFAKQLPGLYHRRAERKMESTHRAAVGEKDTL